MSEFLTSQRTMPEIVPVSRLGDYLKYPSTNAVRQYIFYNTNGFKDKVVKYLGKRQYLNMPAFFNWVEESNGCRVA